MILNSTFLRSVSSLALVFIFFFISSAQDEDWRNIKNGDIIPDEAYSDQPYIVKTDDGAWLCAMTTGAGHEGVTGQHIITWRSLDQGKTWIDKRDVEPSDGPEASYAVLLKAPSGRIFVFYNHNTDNIRSIIGNNPPYANGLVKRVDSQGYFVFKYSDDHGKTWSEKRYTIPVRNFEIDKRNVYEGDIQFFWNVGKAFTYKNEAFVPLIKVGGFGEGFFTSNEGALLMSPNLLEVEDPAGAKWETLPEGEIGLRTPQGGGPIAGEQSYVVLSDGSFFSVYRTIDGYPAHSYSRDQGRTWSDPQYLTYSDGRKVKHPRAANFVWKCENGKFLYWFHNHGGEFIKNHPSRRSMGFLDRNPVWMLGGSEKKTDQGIVIGWSQPEILFYDQDPMIRMSYPDLVEEDGEYYITETQKDIARVHKVDKTLLNRLWNQLENPRAAEEGMVLDQNLEGRSGPSVFHAPEFPAFYVRSRKVDGSGAQLWGGFTLDVKFKLDEVVPGDILLSTIDKYRRGWQLGINDDKSLELSMSDGRTESVWSCDPRAIKSGQDQHVSVIVDGGPSVISFVIDGVLNDGGLDRQFGWGRFNPFIQSVEGSTELLVEEKLSGKIHHLKIYDRAILISEAIGNHKMGSR